MRGLSQAPGRMRIQVLGAFTVHAVGDPPSTPWTVDTRADLTSRTWRGHGQKAAPCASISPLISSASPSATILVLFTGSHAPRRRRALLRPAALVHDLAHGALRLPRRIAGVALALGGLVILTSGHGLRLVHLRHHAIKLGDDAIKAPRRGLFRQRDLAAPPGRHAVRVRAG